MFRPPKRRHHSGRELVPAGNVLAVMLLCLIVWTFLYAPTLKRNAEASPLGARRTAALVVLDPLVAVSNVLQVTRVANAMQTVLGKNPNGPAGGTLGAIPSVAPSPLPSPGSPIRVPTSNDKLRIAVVGDSQAIGLGVGLQQMTNPNLVRLTNFGRVATGLARQDYFNWNTAMAQIVKRFNPDLVVVMVGENDMQAQVSPNGSAISIYSPRWNPAYQARVTQFAKIATSAGARLVWVGIPIVQDKNRWPVFQRIDRLIQAGIGSNLDTAYLDAWDLFARNGRYAPYLINEHGTLQQMRTSDGMHMTSAGDAYLARAVVRLAEQDFHLAPEVQAFTP
jgi:hypothetical protein